MKDNENKDLFKLHNCTSIFGLRDKEKRKQKEQNDIMNSGLGGSTNVKEFSSKAMWEAMRERELEEEQRGLRQHNYDNLD